LSYRRQSRQSYEQVRRRGRLLTSIAPRKGGGGQVFSEAGHKAYANIMDLSRFLARYLSGKSNVMVSALKNKAGFGVSLVNVGNKPFYKVTVPDWRTYDIPLQGFDKYRIYRNGIWHEASHARYTPDGIFTLRDLEFSVANIVEDRRIEDLGVGEWPGYLPERLHSNAYGYAMRPDVGDLWSQAGKYSSDPSVEGAMERAARYEAFLQRLIVGKIKGADKIPKEERERIEEVAREVESELRRMRKFSDDHSTVFDRLRKLVKKVIEKLNLKGHTPDPPKTASGPDGRGGDWEDTFTEEYARQRGGKPEDVEGEMEEFFDEAEKEAEAREEKAGKKEEVCEKCGRHFMVGNKLHMVLCPVCAEAPGGPSRPNGGGEEGLGEEGEEGLGFGPASSSEVIKKARKGSDQVEKEYEQVQAGDIDELTPLFLPVASAVPPEAFRDKKFIDTMNVALREWRIGRKEIVGERGARLSVPHYIRHKEEPFVTRIKKSARGRKILVIADFSGSMKHREDDYKKALVSSLEVLDGIGSKTALFGFGGEINDLSSQFFFKVKRFEEPRWRPDHSAKTAALSANYPSTPMHNAYEGLANYIKKHRPDVTVTITDGMPHDEEETARNVKELKRHTRMVAFGIATDEPAIRMEETLKGFGYHKVFSVDSVNEIPRKLVGLLAPT
jgi:hypothetical protein